MKSVPTSIRLDEKLLEDIAFIAYLEGIDKTKWIKNTLSAGAREALEDLRKQMAEDYVKLRIDDAEYLRLTRSKKISEDIKKARAEFLQRLVTSKDDE